MSCMLLLVSLMAGLIEANPEKTFILPGGAEIEMVWIEPGTFMMGGDQEQRWMIGDNRPPHQVTITRGIPIPVRRRGLQALNLASPHRSGIGVCVSSRYHNGLVLGRRPKPIRGLCVVFEELG